MVVLPMPRREGAAAVMRWALAAGLLAAANPAAPVVAAYVSPSALAARPPAVVRPIAIFGKDDRAPLPQQLSQLGEQIGVLFNNRARMVCTAFCVAPAIIATAAHCVAPPAASQGNHKVLSSDFLFARGYGRIQDRTRIEGFATRSTAQNIVAGNFRMQTRPPIDAVEDWALVRLARPSCKGGFLPFQPLSVPDVMKLAEGGQLYQIAYHRDLPGWQASYASPCQVARNFGDIEWTRIAGDFKSPEQIVLHTCDTGDASSGSPILADTALGPVVVALNVGTYVQPRVVMEGGLVRRRDEEVTVANTAVTVTAMAQALARLQSARILVTGAPIRNLQEHLQALGFYQGRVDGDYGPQLREAIVSYETARGLGSSGLASTALLGRLAGELLGVHRTTAGSSPLPAGLPTNPARGPTPAVPGRPGAR